MLTWRVTFKITFLQKKLIMREMMRMMLMITMKKNISNRIFTGEMDGKASTRVTQVLKGRKKNYEKKKSKWIWNVNYWKESSFGHHHQHHATAFPAVCTVHSSQSSQWGELWDQETDLVKSTFLFLQWFKGRMGTPKRENFRKSSKGGGGHFQSKNLYCRFWTLNRAFSAWKWHKRDFLGYVFNQLPHWTVVLHASHGK